MSHCDTRKYVSTSANKPAFVLIEYTVTVTAVCTPRAAGVDEGGGVIKIVVRVSVPMVILHINENGWGLHNDSTALVMAGPVLSKR
jgi:hypothetical protein